MHAKTLRKIRKAARNRAKIHGTGTIPRLSVFRSNRYIKVQLIDDNTGKTILSGSTDAKVKENKTKQAEALGAQIAKAVKDKGISQVVFDRGSYKYHGRVKALAESVRSNGVKI